MIRRCINTLTCSEIRNSWPSWDQEAVYHKKCMASLTCRTEKHISDNKDKGIDEAMMEYLTKHIENKLSSGDLGTVNLSAICKLTNFKTWVLTVKPKFILLDSRSGYSLHEFGRDTVFVLKDDIGLALRGEDEAILLLEERNKEQLFKYLAHQ